MWFSQIILILSLFAATITADFCKWKTYDNTLIVMRTGSVFKLHKNESREACQDKCKTATNIKCRSINYEKAKSNCYLVESTIDQAKKNFIYRSPYPSFDLMVCEKVDPVNGGWSDWQVKGGCSKSCGGGKQTYRRTCTKPEPQYGGKNCVGAKTKTEDCNTKPCPLKFVSLRRTNWDARFKKRCGNDQALVRIISVHNNRKEDRVWTYYCSKGYSLNDGTAAWSGYVNNWDAVLNYVCPNQKIITGFYSYHHNWKEDRRWRIRCTSSNKKHTNCRWTGYVNNWDGRMDYRLSNTNQVITGVYSHHNNHKEDRLWKFRVCNLQ